MPPPQKGYKTLNHRDTHYRWILQNQRGFNELIVEMSASVNGQVLIAKLPTVVNLKMVPLAIDFARANSWKPEEKGEPYRLIWRRGQFLLADTTE
jgi:hypothetical protein